MKFYSTNHKSPQVSIKEAILQSLPPDNGLYMPDHIPLLGKDFIKNLDKHSFQEIAFTISKNYFKNSIDDTALQNLIDDALNFPAPVIRLKKDIYILELFHGPTLAFKDFGARFMARVMNHYWKEENQKLNILVATSGDTGGAVAAGFSGLENIDVTILYPKGKVSELQESQLTTWGGNIKSLEIEGDFDDCQKIVKTAFLDADIAKKLRLSSANSINIARLIPQSFYYFEAFKQTTREKEISFVVPSGNFGNLTAGLLAKKMGLPISRMIAATNANDIFTKYIQSGKYEPKPAVPTLSNAMDIGSPSNFARILDIHSSTWNKVSKNISSYSFDDQNTISQIKRTHKENGYVLDPHTAVGVLAAHEYRQNHDENLIVLSTAHPVKFSKEMEPHLPFTIPYPAYIESEMKKKGNKITLSNKFEDIKDFLLS